MTDIDTEPIEIRREGLPQFGMTDPAILRDPDLSTTARLVYALLCCYAGGAGPREAYPSKRTLAKHVGCTKRTVIRALGELAERGVLRIERQQDAKGQWCSSRYWLRDFQPGVVSQVSRGSDTDVTRVVSQVSQGVVTQMSHQNNTNSEQTNEQTNEQAEADASGALPGLPEPQRRTKGTRLNPDWQPSPALVAWTREHCPRVNVAGTVETFVDYWLAKPGQSGVKVDWDATWRNWARRDQERMGGARNGHTPVSDFSNGQGWYAEDRKGHA